MRWGQGLPSQEEGFEDTREQLAGCTGASLSTAGGFGKGETGWGSVLPSNSHILPQVCGWRKDVSTGTWRELPEPLPELGGGVGGSRGDLGPACRVPHCGMSFLLLHTVCAHVCVFLCAHVLGPLMRTVVVMGVQRPGKQQLSSWGSRGFQTSRKVPITFRYTPSSWTDCCNDHICQNWPKLALVSNILFCIPPHGMPFFPLKAQH